MTYALHYDNIDNMYTSFKGFQLVEIWQEKSEIIVITDIKQKIVIIQLKTENRHNTTRCITTIFLL